MEVTFWDMTLRLLVAAICGGIIGFEREMHSQAAGLRTHMVVAIGAALIMIVSIETARTATGFTSDPGRIAAQVVSGIGFLGAGAILRFGMSVKGLTTAACLWTAAGIGLAAGMGYYSGALVATALVFVAIFVFDKIEKRFMVGASLKRFVINANDTPGILGRIETILNNKGLKVKKVGLSQDLAEHKVQMTFMTNSPDGIDVSSLSREIGETAGVESINID